MKKLFGTDGIRGKANEFLTPDLAFKLAQSLGYEFKKQTDIKKPFVLIGRDTRLSGKMLECALTAGFCSVGVDVWLLDVLPTPVIAWLTKYTQAMAGAVISASHNPAYDNGLKFFNSSGFKLSDELEKNIENHIYNDLKGISYVSSLEIGRVYNKKNLVIHYKNFIKNNFKSNLSFNILLDTANGATYKLAPQIYNSLGINVSTINKSPDGLNINLNCGSTHLNALKKRIKQFDLGLAFDGDGDRLLAVTPDGKEINGDQIMYICLKYLSSLKNNKVVVGTVMSNLAFEQKVNKMNIKFVRTKVGDRYVLEKMLNTGAQIGGEESGHIIFTDLSTTGDGIITGLQFLTAIHNSKKTINELLNEIKLYPQILKNVKGKNIKEWDSKKEILEVIEKAKKLLQDKGQILIRPSGTEPLLRIMVQGENEELIKQVSDMLENTIKKYVN